jgi:hypothetical protein
MVLKYTNLAFHFILELCALAAVVYWGFKTGDGLLLKILLGIGIPVLIAAAWGTFRVPNDPGSAPVVIPGALRLALELAVMGIATWSLAAAGQGTLAWVFGLAVIINYGLMYDRIPWLLGLVKR